LKFGVKVFVSSGSDVVFKSESLWH